MHSNRTMNVFKPIQWLAIMAGAVVFPSGSRAQTTAFTYQGHLMVGNAPANGSYDLTFGLFSSATGSSPIGPILTNKLTSISNGLFTVTLDFGNSFSGASRWLQIAAKTNNGDSFAILTPRQPVTSTPYAIRAANLSGPLPASQLPTGVITNGASGVALTGVFSGTIGSVSNLVLSPTGTGLASVNYLRFEDTPANQQVKLNAARLLDVQAAADGSFWFGNDFTTTVDHDLSLHAKHDATWTVDNSSTETTGVNRSIAVGNNLDLTVGGSAAVTFENALNLTAGNALVLTSQGHADWRVTGDSTDIIGQTQATSIGANYRLLVGDAIQATAGNRISLSAPGGVGIGTVNPQAGLHVYGPQNPTVVRVQSSGTPGFGRIEFVSDPQGSANEWRPAFMQSLDAGGFTGGLAFFVNGAGANNKFATNEVMRLQNGRVGIGHTAPTTLLQVGNATCNGSTWVNSSDREAK